LLALAAPPEEDVAFLADLLSLPASGRHPLPNLSPQRKKERTPRARGTPVDRSGEPDIAADSAHSELEKVVEILRSIGQENLTSPRIPRTASLKKSWRYPHRDGRGDHAADHRHGDALRWSVIWPAAGRCPASEVRVPLCLPPCSSQGQALAKVGGVRWAGLPIRGRISTVNPA
jgi:hypothetical protein